MEQGFSLTDVLLSLTLMTSTSLALFQQQWHLSHFFSLSHISLATLSQSDNASEHPHLLGFSHDL
ncbi:MAG: hypothetical protein NTW94_05660 [Legionellales bacterium]|nr:hypothetical protein [Legionellales bacterium]